MKILFTQDALANAGAERSHLEILSRFSEGVDVGFAYFYTKHDLKEEYEKAGIRLFFLNVPESYHFPLAVSRLVRLIGRERPDLLVSSLWRADIITRLAAFITGVPLIGTLVNDSYSPIAWEDKKGLKYKLVYWLDRMTASIPIHWIANAQALADSHVRTLGLVPEKISVVYRGRPVSRLLSRASEARSACPEFISGKQSTDPKTTSSGEPPNSPDFTHSFLAVTSTQIFSSLQSVETQTVRKCHFISYGRLLERKGFQDAICAFSEVVKTYPDCTLTIYGEGCFRPQLESLINELSLGEKVNLPGRISDPTTMLHTAHCFLFPSWYEGFSGALIEAMMAGIPIIASDIPMNLEAIEAGESALVFHVQNVDDLSKKMSYAIQNPQKMIKMGNAAQREAIRRFDIEHIAKGYEEVITSVFRKIHNGC